MVVLTAIQMVEWKAVKKVYMTAALRAVQKAVV